MKFHVSTILHFQFAVVVAVTSLTFCQGSPVSQQGNAFKATSTNSNNAQKDVEFLSANEKCKLRFLLNFSFLIWDGKTWHKCKIIRNQSTYTVKGAGNAIK